MTTIMDSHDTALFHVAIINSDGAFAHDRLARYALADIAECMNEEETMEAQQRFFATAEERDAFVEEHNANPPSDDNTYTINFPKGGARYDDEGNCTVRMGMHPNLIEHTAHYTSNTYRADTQDLAARLFYITSLLPNMKGCDLLAIAKGHYTLTVDEESDDEHYIAHLTITDGGDDQ